jgi:hypothetical protein
MRFARHVVLFGLIVVGTGTVFGCGAGDDTEAPDGAPTSDAASRDGSLAEGAGDAGNGTLVVTADASVAQSRPCAAATSLIAAPNDITVGHSITLSASGLDPDDQSSDVTLTWSATGSAGILSGSTGATVVFRCAQAGTASVTVTASMTVGGATCPKTGSLTAVLTCT